MKFYSDLIPDHKHNNGTGGFSTGLTVQRRIGDWAFFKNKQYARGFDGDHLSRCLRVKHPGEFKDFHEYLSSSETPICINVEEHRAIKNPIFHDQRYAATSCKHGNDTTVKYTLDLFTAMVAEMRGHFPDKRIGVYRIAPIRD